MSSKIIETISLTKAYGKVKALDNLNLAIDEKKITGLVGRNGAGKSTFLKLICGFLQKTSGEIRVFSQDPFNNLNVSSNMIFINDNMSFPLGMKIKDLMEIGKMFYKDWDERLAKGLFDYFGLNPEQSYQNLSKGTKSVFNMIIGLSAHAEITVFDEPTAGMDASARKDFYRALLKDYIEKPRTVVISSHYLNEIEEIIEDILIINDGKVVNHLPVADFKELVIGLKGKREVVSGIVDNAEILHSESLGDELYVVVKNDSLNMEAEKAGKAGVELIKMPADDVCTFLTGRNKGGIDDVFKK